jgi:thioesterase domain-containing protein/acyl carrier protein
MLPVPIMIRPELPNLFVPPESDLEKKLVEIWEELIGVEGIGVTDDFFDLGGDSLIGVMVFARIEEVLGRNLPVSILLTASTIRKQVDLIQNQQAEHSFDPVIPIKAQGDFPPIFFVPGKAGYPTRIRHLATKIDAGTPVYALQYLSKDADILRFRSIESMATYYLTAIKKIYPHGPYHLVGESMGGKIAFEMARRLEKQGEKVPILALLDTYNSVESIPKVYIEKNTKILPYYWLLIRKHIFILWHSDWQGRLDYLKFYRKTGGPKIKELIQQPENRSKIKKSSILPENVQQMEIVNIMANNKYEAKPYPGRVILFKALRNANINVLSNGWSDVELGELKIHPLDCYHGSILFDPAVSQLADILRGYIDEHIQKSGQQ